MFRFPPPLWWTHFEAEHVAGVRVDSVRVARCRSRLWEQMPDPRPARAPQMAMAKPRAACDGEEGEQRSWDVGAKVRGHQHHSGLLLT